MQKQRLLLLFICFFLGITVTFSQVQKFKTTKGAIKFYSETLGKWKEWEDLENGVGILIVVDWTNERIKIFSKTNHVFDIIKYYDKKTDSDGDETISMQCVDQDGLKCNVRFLILNSQNGRKQIYIDYSDTTILYNIQNLE
ncbi:MAG: hypothetical protein NTZ59_11185 [Bacteroidetes bacterium]|nr:hypothetical protein [Bacteroidota bacterium]